MNTQLEWGCIVFQVKLSIVCVSKRRHPGKSPYGLNYSAAYPPPLGPGLRRGEVRSTGFVEISPPLFHNRQCTL